MPGLRPLPLTSHGFLSLAFTLARDRGGSLQTCTGLTSSVPQERHDQGCDRGDRPSNGRVPV